MTLERERGKIVRKYKGNPLLWPDGIDSAGDRWYLGHETEWTETRIAVALGEKDAATGGNKTPHVTTVTTSVTAPSSKAERREKKRLAMRRMRAARKALKEAVK